MADVLLHADDAMHLVCVSDIFINEYMPQADGDSIKVYLYLLAHVSDQTFSFSGMAHALRLTQKELCAALKYWGKEGLLRLEYTDSKRLGGIRMLAPVSKLNDIEFLDLDIEDTKEPAEAAPVVEASVSMPPRGEVKKAKASQADPIVQEILCLAQRYLKKQLTLTETNAILYWYDELGFSAELIEYVIEYSIEKGHTGIRYMDSVARAWASEDITTVEAAKKETDTRSAAAYAVMKAMGISGRNLVQDELDAISRWTDTYGFTLDIIAEACSRTVAQTGKSSFAYAESILKSWHEKGVHHLSDIGSADTAHRNRAVRSGSAKKANTFNNFNQRDYDYDKMEEMALKGQNQ